MTEEIKQKITKTKKLSPDKQQSVTEVDSGYLHQQGESENPKFPGYRAKRDMTSAQAPGETQKGVS